MAELKLDVKNLKLLAELEKDGKAPLARIAKKIGVSKEVAQYRFKQLNSSGLIKKFDTIVDYFALGYQCYKLIINLENLKFHMRKKIIDELRKSELVEVNVYLYSDWDLEIDVWVRDHFQFYEFYNNFIDTYSDYIYDKDFSLITKIHVLSHEYLHKGKHIITLGEGSRVGVDDVEEKIIEALEKNPREEILTIAQQLDIPAHTIYYRIEQLTKKGILKGVIPILDPSLAGYNKFNVQLILNKPSQRKAVIDYLKAQPHVTKISEFIGKKDLSFEVNFKVSTELDKFLENLRLHTESVQNFEVMNVIIQ